MNSSVNKSDFLLLENGVKKPKYRHRQGGNVPGGHDVIYNAGKNPFITPVRECNSVPLLHSKADG